MKDVPKIYLVLLCWKIWAFAQSAPQISPEESEFLEDVDDSLKTMVDIITSITNSVDQHTPESCTESLANLNNANSNWNPKGTYVHNDEVVVTCHEGFNSKENITVQTVKCLLGNQWSIMQDCKSTCKSEPEAIENAYTEWSSNEIYISGDVLSVSCLHGFRTPQDALKQSISCLPGDKWSKAIPCTVPTCTLDLKDMVKHASTDWDPQVLYSPGDEVIIECDPGYRTKKRTTKQTSKCLAENAWSYIDSCQEECPSPFALHGSLCVYHDSTNRTWREARKSCSSIKPDYDSYLAVLESYDKQEQFLNYISTIRGDIDDSGWLAAHDMFEEGWFIWNDGNDLVGHFDEFKFVMGQPDNMDGDEHCVAFHPNGLEDALCDVNKAAFCLIKM